MLCMCGFFVGVAGFTMTTFINTNKMVDVLSDYSEDFEEDEPEVKSAAKPSLDTQTPRRTMTDARKKTKSHRLPPKPKVGPKVRAYSEARQVGSNWQGSSPRRDRVLSAKGHTIKALQSALTDTRRELEEAKKDNRLLKRIQLRQERELNRVQTLEGELPHILLRHSEEIRVLKEQLRRSQEAATAHQGKEASLREELLRLNDRKRKLEEVVRKKHLLERAALTTQLKESRDSLVERDQKIAELQHSLEVIGRNHGSEIRALMLKHKALSTEAESLRETSKKMKTHLRDKEREMDVMNIYSQRLARPTVPRKPLPPSLLSCSSQTELSCPPAKVVSLQTKRILATTSSQTELLPETPAKLMLAIATQTDTPSKPTLRAATTTTPPPPVPRPRTDSPAPSTPTAIQPHPPVVLQALPTAKIVDSSLPRNTQASSEDRQKKDLLLSKLKALDSQKAVAPGSQTLPTSSNMVKSSPPPPDTTSRPAAEDEQKKQLLLAKLMAIDNKPEPKTTEPVQPAKTSSANRSNTSLASWPESIENLHNGKPAYPSESRQASGKKPLAKDESYQPTFGRRALGESKPTNGMIFGGGLENTSTAVKPPAAAPGKSYPWENKVELERGVVPANQALDKPLLPLRSRPHEAVRTEPADHSITEPDDLEELIL